MRLQGGGGNVLLFCLNFPERRSNEVRERDGCHQHVYPAELTLFERLRHPQVTHA